MTWQEWLDAAFKAVVTVGVFVGTSQFWQLKGKFDGFLSNHWPSFVKQFEAVHKKVDQHGERLARLEGEK